jgi:hypothetical protein
MREAARERMKLSEDCPSPRARVWLHRGESGDGGKKGARKGGLFACCGSRR